MLIDSPRLTDHDRSVWGERAALDDLYLRAQGRRLHRMELDAITAIASWAASRRGYVGVSWGKDSVTVADLALRAGIGWPLVWVRVDGVENPDCPLVRDAFLAAWPEARDLYHEIRTERPTTGLTSSLGFRVAAEAHGDAHVSGVRGQESRGREMRMRRWGLHTERTLAPIGRWKAEHVFAYLRRRDLPVHPAYACSLGGTLDRGRIRVGAIGGSRGTGRGRREWEEHYYPEALRNV